VSVDRELQALTDGPGTTTVNRRVKPGHEAANEAVLAEINHAAGRFRGYLGVEVQRWLLRGWLRPSDDPAPQSDRRPDRR
jgi:antibiotic biosynthesis monooxygenase (ABM) superfamily enzyme